MTVFSQAKVKGLRDETISVYTTAANTGMRLALSGEIPFTAARQPVETEISVVVNPLKKYQTIIGFGGAITDASAEVFARLPLQKQQELLRAYYSPADGIGYTTARTNINSCDFSSDSYTYVNTGDKQLSSFNIGHDQQFRIPLIRKALKTAGGSLFIFASPWSPPAFMKDNNDMLHGGKLLPEYRQAWANYFVHFIKAYAKQGIAISAVTVQNEPLANVRYESCQYTAEEERDFIKFDLGPALTQQGLKDEKIIIWDHNRDLVNQWSDVILSDAVAAGYVWGVGFHWYETWTGGRPMFNNIKQLHEAYPDKSLILTEACVERFDASKLQFWPNAERYGAAMINDLNNGARAWTDWNILLDAKGGPNHVNNFCFAPVHTNDGATDLIYTPSYYYIGHFSKFIRPGARRINSVSTRSNLLCTSFINTDGKIVTVVMNENDEAIAYKLYLQTKYADLTIQPHAIQTLVYASHP